MLTLYATSLDSTNIILKTAQVMASGTLYTRFKTPTKSRIYLGNLI